MTYVVVCIVAFLASSLTFFSGFGLGTLLLPAFALFFPVQSAVALTAIVHFLNGVFKLLLVWRHIAWGIVWRFGILAVVGAVLGATVLIQLGEASPLFSYTSFGRSIDILPAKLIVGALLLLFACAEILPSFRAVTFPSRYMPLGGLMSGFFGGLAGMQGALRSAFLVKSGLTKEVYVATGAAIALLIDVSRLTVYIPLIGSHRYDVDNTLLAAAVSSAFAGAYVGNRYLPKVTMLGIRNTVAVLLVAVAVGLIAGIL